MIPIQELEAELFRAGIPRRIESFSSTNGISHHLHPKHKMSLLEMGVGLLARSYLGYVAQKSVLFLGIDNNRKKEFAETFRRLHGRVGIEGVVGSLEPLFYAPSEEKFQCYHHGEYVLLNLNFASSPELLVCRSDEKQEGFTEGISEDEIFQNVEQNLYPRTEDAFQKRNVLVQRITKNLASCPRVGFTYGYQKNGKNFSELKTKLYHSVACFLRK